MATSYDPPRKRKNPNALPNPVYDQVDNRDFEKEVMAGSSIADQLAPPKKPGASFLDVYTPKKKGGTK